MKIDLKLVLAMFFVLFSYTFPVIWSLNVLFHLNIPYSFDTCLATFILVILMIKPK